MGALVFGQRVEQPSRAPMMLTPGEGAVEQTSLSPDGRFLFYATNAGDIERRHVWKVPTAGGAAEQLTKGETIETYPAALPSGSASRCWAATRSGRSASASCRRPAARRSTSIRRSRSFPIDAEVDAAAGADEGAGRHSRSTTSSSCPKDLKPGEKRPAIVFVHGGPVRQMLLGYHYMHFYHVAYAVNQWLASRGYIVMSVNYRSGIGYGKSFRTAPNTGGRGNAEYQDVLAGGKYLQSRPDVDPNRVGIWGLSYGGVLTAQALARNSDIFKVGVDLAGVHLWGSSLDPRERVVQVVGDLGDRHLEIAGAAGARRRRSQRAVLADDRPRAAAARAQRVPRADRLHRRHARAAAAQALSVRVQPARGIHRPLPEGRAAAQHRGQPAAPKP